MNCNVDAMVQKRVFQLFRKHTFASDHRQRIALNIASRLDDLDVDLDPRIQQFQTLTRLFSLPQREFRTTGTDYERASHFSSHSSRPKGSCGACEMSGSLVS